MKLNKGEIICPKCNGTGINVFESEGRKSRGVFICNICGGEKKIDWIQNIQRIPKKPRTYLSIHNNSGKDIYIKEVDLMIKKGHNELWREFSEKWGKFISNHPDKCSELCEDNELDLVEYLYKGE